jgi:hypothetical protein
MFFCVINDCLDASLISFSGIVGVADESSMVCWCGPSARCVVTVSLPCAALPKVVLCTQPAVVAARQAAGGARVLQTGNRLCRERLEHIATAPWWPCRAVLARVARGIGNR